MRRPLAGPLLALLLIPAAARAQAQATAVSAIPDTIPLHTLPDEAGHWAAGAGYKVRFGHEAVDFYPALPTHSRHYPLSWRTESVRVDGTDQLDDRPRTRAFERRFEWLHENVSEVWHVRPEGVEQTFVLHRPVAGDLVVTGVLTTDLTANDVSPASQSLQFRGPGGETLVEYGAAIAIDATGRRTDMATSLTGDRVQLHLGGAWLRDAVFPVTIDPLITPQAITSNSIPVVTADIVRDETSQRSLVVYTRQATATDIDVYGRLMEDDYSTYSSVYANLSPTISVKNPQVAFLESFGDWAIVVEKAKAGESSRVELYVHQREETQTNSGAFRTIPGSVEHDQNPSVAGSRSGLNLFVAWQREPDRLRGSDLRSQTYVAVYTLVFGPTLSAMAAVAPSSTLDQEHPMLPRNVDALTNPVVVWQEKDRSVTGDEWDIVLTDAQWAVLSQGEKVVLGDPNLTGVDRFAPAIDGDAERFAVTYTTAPAGTATGAYGDRVAIQRVDWPTDPLEPITTQPARTLATAQPGEGITTGGRVRPIAFDRETRSHWTVAWHTDVQALDVARVGYTGAVVEQAVVHRSPGSNPVQPASVCHDSDADGCLLAYGGTVGNVLYIARLNHDSRAAATPYGAGCAGAISADSGSSAPYAGSEFVSISLQIGVPNAATVLLLSAVPSAPQPLGNGCFLHLGGLIFVGGTGATRSSGNATFTFPFPDAPLVTGDVFWQFLQLQGGAITTSQALVTSIH